ncbi:MAG TPA: hypothetical protein VMH90_01765 [Thermoplasmata archaeon]|nr:hypothetical protein [Thermoplasmata archaeon]
MTAEETNSPHEFRHPACEFVGLADEGETVAICGRPAYGVIADASGARHFACADHLTSVKARYSTGAWSHRPASVVARPFPEAMP